MEPGNKANAIPCLADSYSHISFLSHIRPPLEDALGAPGMSKKLDPLSSLKDAPTLTASSLQGAPPLGATSSGNLVGKKGSLGNKPHLLLDGGSNEYDDDFDRCVLMYFFDNMNF